MFNFQQLTSPRHRTKSQRAPQFRAWSHWQSSKPLIQQVPNLSDLTPFSRAKPVPHTWLSAPTWSNLNSSFSLHIWLVKHKHIQNILPKWICKMCLFSLTVFGIWRNIDVCSQCKRHGRWWGSLRSYQMNSIQLVSKFQVVPCPISAIKWQIFINWF